MRPKVYVELCLEEQFTRVYIVKAKESRLKLAIDNKTEDAAQVGLLKLAIIVLPIES